MTPNPKAPQPPARPGTLTRSVERSGRMLRWLLFSLLLSISLEWLGMLFWWPDAGVEHSRQMLATELAFLDQDVPKSLLVEEPQAFAAGIAGSARQLCLRFGGLLAALSPRTRPVPESLAPALEFAGQGAIMLAPYAQAAINMIQVFVLRLAILMLALPAFALFSLVGLIDGLVRRDLRRWGGGRESSYLYHHAKRSIWPFVLIAWAAYLALPVSVHPAAVVVPFACCFGLGVSVTASKFKKYL